MPSENSQKKQDQIVESSLFYGGMAVFVVGFASAIYFTRYVQKLPQTGVTTSIITVFWIQMLVTTSSIGFYLSYLFKAYEKKSYKAALLTNERKALIDYARTGIFTYDENGIIETANTKMAAMLGKQESDLEGKFNIYEHGPYKNVGLDEFFKKCYDGVSRNMEVHLPSPDGADAWLNFMTGPVIGPDGSGVYRCLVIVEDISRRKKMEAELTSYTENLETTVTQRTKQLSESQKRLFLVIENSPVILFAFDTDGVLTLSIGKGLQALGIEPGEHVGMSIEELYGDNVQLMRNVMRALAGEEFVYKVNIRDVTLDIYHSPIRNEKREIIGVTCVAITHTRL